MTTFSLLASAMAGTSSKGSVGATLGTIALFVVFVGVMTYIKVKIRRRRIARWEAQGIIEPRRARPARSRPTEAPVTPAAKKLPPKAKKPTQR